MGMPFTMASYLHSTRNIARFSTWHDGMYITIILRYLRKWILLISNRMHMELFINFIT